MMIISHRGNINGPNTAKFGENHPDSIRHIIEEGLYAELDLRLIDKKLLLGHDSPDYEIKESFLKNYSIASKLFVHCKNIDALLFLSKMKKSDIYFDYFWHENDDYTLTFKSKIWTYPRSSAILTSKSIAVIPENVKEWDTKDCYGICTDYIKNGQ